VIAQAGAMTPDPAIRALSADDAAALPPGADHYRAFVGPPERYDLMAGAQFALLFMLGLREHHRLLDFGCGSLRAGKLLIPYLRAERYFGIEPEAWLVEDGIAREVGADLVAVKRPRFSHNADWRSDVFGAPFDMILAQSIATHTGARTMGLMFQGFAQALAPQGLAVFSYIDGPASAPAAAEQDWLYPACFTFARADVARIAHEAGLAFKPIPWPHAGGAQWALLARTEEVFPSDAMLAALAVAPWPR
jgi:SAM-dependent methyltransferase